MNGKKYTIIFVVILLILSILVMLNQLQTAGYVSRFTSDTLTYTSWAWQFTESLKEGILYPRWASLNFWGYGSPAFILYPPLAFYLVAFFNMLTGSVLVAMNATKFTALFISATGMFFLVREFYPGKIALLTASLYIVFPYNIFWIYLGASFATPISLIWFPLIILFIYKYLRDRHVKYILYAGMVYGGLILTHLIVAYMFTFIFSAFIAYMSFIKRKPKTLMVIPVIVIIGFLLSAVYVFPLFHETQFLNVKDFGDGLVFSDFFVVPDMTDKVPSGHFWPVLYEDYIIYIAAFSVCLLLLMLQTRKLKRTKSIDDINSINTFFVGITIGSIFLLFGISSFLWKIIPFFTYIQYPTRWLIVTYFSLSFLSAAWFRMLDIKFKTRRRPHYIFIVLLFLVCFFFDYGYISKAHIFTPQELIPFKGVNFAPEHLPSGVDKDKIKKGSDAKILLLDGKGTTSISLWNSAERIIEIAANDPLIVRIRTFNFPGWRAYIDGVETSIKTEKNDGAMLIKFPSGRHTLVVKFEDTPIRYYAKLISVVSLATIILLILLSEKLHREADAL